MSNGLTEQQLTRLITAIQTASQSEVQQLIQSKSSFVAWVEKLGLMVLARKISELSGPLWEQFWSAITSAVEYIGEALSDVLDAIFG